MSSILLHQGNKRDIYIYILGSMNKVLKCNSIYYHITTNLGNRVILTPRVPTTSLDAEGDIPRICVSTSVYDCIRGVTGSRLLQTHHIHDALKGSKVLCIYSTQDSPFKPPACLDFRRNSEMWFLKDTTFVRAGFICASAWNQGTIHVVEHASTFDCVVEGVKISRKEIK